MEIDPYDPTFTPRKHTAMGRFKHEAATVTLSDDGRVGVYSGDDQRFDYVYKFISNDRYNAFSRSANLDRHALRREVQRRRQRRVDAAGRR